MGGSFPGMHASVILLVFHRGVAAALVPVMDEDPDTWVATRRGMRMCFLTCQWHSLPGPSKLSGRLLSSLGASLHPRYTLLVNQLCPTALVRPSMHYPRPPVEGVALDLYGASTCICSLSSCHSLVQCVCGSSRTVQQLSWGHLFSILGESEARAMVSGIILLG